MNSRNVLATLVALFLACLGCDAPNPVARAPRSAAIRARLHALTSDQREIGVDLEISNQSRFRLEFDEVAITAYGSDGTTYKTKQQNGGGSEFILEPASSLRLQTRIPRSEVAKPLQLTVCVLRNGKLVGDKLSVELKEALSVAEGPHKSSAVGSQPGQSAQDATLADRVRSLGFDDSDVVEIVAAVEGLEKQTANDELLAHTVALAKHKDKILPLVVQRALAGNEEVQRRYQLVLIFVNTDAARTARDQIGGRASLQDRTTSELIQGAGKGVGCLFR